MPTYIVTIQQEITVTTPSRAEAKALAQEFPPRIHIVGSMGSLRAQPKVKVVRVKEQTK